MGIGSFAARVFKPRHRSLVRLSAGLVLGVLAVDWTPVWAESPLDDEGRLVRFERDVAPILRVRCLECHGPDDAKNDFRVDDYDSLLSYVEPEDLESSVLYTDYLVSDDEDYLMPPTTHGGPLSAAELAVLQVWINEGADWPDGFELVAVNEPSPAAELAKPVVVAKSLGERIWSFQGFLHPATVHFPIALLLIGAFFVVLGVKWPAVGTQIPLACLLTGALFSLLATMMGWSFAIEQGYGSWTKVDPDAEIFWHRWSGVVVTVAACLFAVVALLTIRAERPALTRTWKVGLLLVAALVGAVGHQGGELTYGKDFYPKAFRVLFGEIPTPTDELAPEPADEPTPTTG